MLNPRRVCHVVLAIDTSARTVLNSAEREKRVRSNFRKAREEFSRWIKERDPQARIYASTRVGIVPTMWLSVLESVARELLRKSTRPPIVESIVVVDS